MSERGHLPRRMAGEVGPTCFDPLGTDPEQARDAARLGAITPQPQDIPLDMIETEAVVSAKRKNRS